MVNTLLLAAILITLTVWLLQELVGRRYRIDQLREHMQKALDLGADAGFPLWLRVLSGMLILSWLALAVGVYLKRDGDFALILVALVLFSGAVCLLDYFLFRQRRVQLMGAASVQQVLSRIKVDKEKQDLVDWAETDFLTAEYAKSFFPVLLVVLILRSFLLEPFKIPSASMVPTLQVHDFILVNKFAYGLRLPVLGTKIMPVGMPKRGDVMVFFPPNDNRYFIKRVIGLPGDEINLVDNVLYINGVRMEQQVLRVDASGIINIRENLQPLQHLIQLFPVPTGHSNYHTVVPQGEYFMMGDNRDNSSDSRFWGTVPERNIVGQAVYVWMHWESFLGLPLFSRNGVIQ
ncbi:MAG TPA: signal peptidase I [Pseudomonadales bacterium]|nr:signal peptidase I [Pseudomonadales bacterium]